MKWSKRLLSLVVSLLALEVLWGCGMVMDKRAKTAQEAVENHLAKEDKDNARMDASMSMEIKVGAAGISMDIPVDMTMNMDVFDKQNMHGDMHLETTMFNEEASIDFEVYMVENKGRVGAYVYDSDEKTWGFTEDADIDDSLLNINLDARNFADSKIEYDKSNQLYTIEQSFEDFQKSGMFGDMSGNLLESMDLGDGSIEADYSDARAIYVFDSDYNLMSLNLRGMDYSGTVESDGMDVDVSLKMDVSVEWYDHGKIKASDVEVPTSVADSAVTEEDALDVLNGGSSAFGTSDGLGDDGIDDSFGGYDDDEGFTYEPEADEWDGKDRWTGDDASEATIDASGMEVKDLFDKLGAYNGVAFTDKGDSWADTFGADGWEFVEDVDSDFSYSTVFADNAKYGEFAQLMVYNEAWDNATKEEILADGFYGYDIDMYYADSYPNMTWNGVTFGASADMLLSAYGEYDNMYDGEMYTAYMYDIEDTEKDIEIEFYVYKDKGLMGVNLRVYPEY